MCHKIILDDKLSQEDLNVHVPQYHTADKLCQEDLNVHVPQDNTGLQALSG